MSGRFLVCPVHVGREREVEELRAAAATIAAGGRALLITGDAGVGKSRLAGEALATVEPMGFLTLTGHCGRDGATPYAPLKLALRRHLRRCDAATVRSLFEGAARPAGGLLPEVADLVGMVSPESVGTEEIEAAVWELLTRLCAQRPCLLLLEDLQWAGTDMLRLLLGIVAEVHALPLWIVATCRSDEVASGTPLAAAIAELSRLRLCDRIHLTSLGTDHVAAMLGAILEGAPIGSSFTDAVRDRTGGNPFFIEELCRVLAERGDVVAVAADWGRRDVDQLELPASVHETAVARLQRLGADDVQLLRIAAVAGMRIDEEVVRVAAGTDAEAVSRAITAGLEHQLIEARRAGSLTEYWFRHALTREGLVAGVMGPQRQELSRRVGRALAGVHAAALDDVAGQVADRLFDAGDGAEAVDYALRAARRAAAVGALDEALGRYGQVLEAQSLDEAGRVDLLLEAAESATRGRQTSFAAILGGHLTAAARFADEAMSAARRRGDPVAQSRALAVRAADRTRKGEHDHAIALLEEALRLVEGRRDRWELGATVGLAQRLARRGDSTAALPLLDRATALAHTLDDASIHPGIDYLRGLLDHGPPLTTGRGGRAAVEADEGGDPTERMWALLEVGNRHFRNGDFTLAVDAESRSLEIAEAMGSPFAAWPELARAAVLAFAGDLGALESGIARWSGRLTDPMALSSLHGAVTLLALHRGDVAAALPVAREAWGGLATDDASAVAVRAGMLARCLAVSGDLDTARVLVAVALEACGRSVRSNLISMFAPDVAEAQAAAARTQDLASFVGAVRAVTPPDAGAANLAALLLCEGIHSTHVGDLEPGRSALETAEEMFARMPFPWRQGQCRLALALNRLRAGDLVASRGAAAAAEELATRFAIRPLHERSAAALRRAGVRLAAPSRAGRDASHGLTARELEIVAIVAEGLTNAEIGRRLHLSPKTVVNHVSSVLGKLDLRSRTEIARWALENGVVDPRPR